MCVCSASVMAASSPIAHPPHTPPTSMHYVSAPLSLPLSVSVRERYMSGATWRTVRVRHKAADEQIVEHLDACICIVMRAPCPP